MARADFKVMKVGTCRHGWEEGGIGGVEWDVLFSSLHSYICTCLHTQDIAIHTRISPNHRQLVFKKFLERVNQSPKVGKFLKLVIRTLPSTHPPI